MFISFTQFLVILVADDDPTSRRLISASLCRAGFKIEACADADSALNHLISEGQAEVLVTDAGMLGSSNKCFLALEARVLRPTLPVVYFSDRPIDAAQSVPDAYYLSKPYQVDLIAAAVREAVAAARMIAPGRVVGRAA